MENKTIEWGWEKGQPLNVRSKEHQEFLIEQYNRNRPVDKQVKTMSAYLKALETNEVKHHGIRCVTITECRFYSATRSNTIELPENVNSENIVDWLMQGGTGLEFEWETDLDSKFNNVRVVTNGVKNLDEEMVMRETKYYIEDEDFGGKL